MDPFYQYGSTEIGAWMINFDSNIRIFFEKLIWNSIYQAVAIMVQP